MDKVPENTNDRPTDEDVVKFGNDVLGINIATKESENVEITQIEKKNSLKVIRVTTEVEGEYGTYIKTVDGVKINDRLYSDIDMVKKEKIKLAAEYNTKIDSVMEKIRALNAEMKEIQDIGMKEIERFTEIESVFGL
jgi:seryl-tRNA synthetase